MKLKKNRLYDEYGQKVDWKEFREMIVDKQTDRKGYEEHIVNPAYGALHETVDEDGYRIAKTEEFW